MAVILIIAAGLVAYHNSFTGPFLFDDSRFILDNPTIHFLWSPLIPLGHTTRPLVNLSLALNYALGRLDVRGYHALNLVIHLGAALLLFGLIRRTLLTAPLRERYGGRATGLALTAALLWTVHPLQTQSVTYIIQRSEALMGGWYLLTLYSLLRSATGPHPRRWQGLALLACAGGMASKPIMVTAPLMAWLYDRVFLSGSFRDAWRRRRALYLSLMATWALLALLLLRAPGEYHKSAGLSTEGVTPLAYALTQPGVILHYLRLALWPHPLVLDYHWPVATTLPAILWPAVGLGALVAGTLWAWRRAPALGFLGAWVFVILAPSSSVIPIKDLAFEHRMYLPLAGVLALLVFGTAAGLQRLVPAQWQRPVAVGLVTLLVAALSWGTIRRNADYASNLSIWRDTVAKRPQNTMAHQGFGVALADLGQFEEAERHCRLAVELDPRSAEARHNLATILARQGRRQEALPHFVRATQLRPEYPAAFKNLALALTEEGRADDAIVHYREAIRLNPQYVLAYYELGNLCAGQGKTEEAIANYLEALRWDPRHAEAYHNLGIALGRQGKVHDAQAYLAKAIQLKPDYADAYGNLGSLLAMQGRREEAMAYYTKALQLNPAHANVRKHLEAMTAGQVPSQ